MGPLTANVTVGKAVSQDSLNHHVNHHVKDQDPETEAAKWNSAYAFPPVT